MPTHQKFLVPLIVHNSTIFLLCIQWLWIPFTVYFCEHKKTPSSSSPLMHLRLCFGFFLNFLRRYSKDLSVLINTLLIFKNNFHSLCEKSLKHFPEYILRALNVFQWNIGILQIRKQTINQILITFILLYQSLPCFLLLRG